MTRSISSGSRRLPGSRTARFRDPGLPDGYHTVIGAHGATLSGGQRQRVGIARTLYHDPDVLIFDESFTGLDAENRDAIFDNLFRLDNKTLIFSRHEQAIAARCESCMTGSVRRQ